MAGDDPSVGDAAIEQSRQRATPVLIDILSRYPLAPTGKNRVAHLMSDVDLALRHGSTAPLDNRFLSARLVRHDDPVRRTTVTRAPVSGVPFSTGD